MRSLVVSYPPPAPPKGFVERRAAFSLRAGLLLLVLVEGEQCYTRDLDDLEADTGDVTHGVTAASESGDENFVLKIGGKKRKHKTERNET